MEKKTHLVMVSIPAFSHQAAILSFAKRLLELHRDFHVTCIVPTIGPLSSASKSFIESLPSSIDTLLLPPVNFEDLRQVSPLSIQLQLAVSRSMPFVHDALKSLSSSSALAAMILDPIASEAIEFARQFNILSYIYFPSSAMMLSFCLCSLKLDQEISCQFRDHPNPIHIPGCVPLHGRDFTDSCEDRSSLGYKQFLQRSKRYRLADGVLVNSFMEMEAEAVRALQGGINGSPFVYPVGPIIQNGSNSEGNGSGCLKWLDNQPPNSVLYVCFGSGGSLSQEQLNELALGLELSGKNFLWVIVRAPSDRPSDGYLSEGNEDPLHYLPSGFLERTKEQGLVVSPWAPQVQILSHNSTGGFLTHCGWNSTLESILLGLPMIAWPLFAEQRTNAAMLTDGLKVGLRPRVNGNGIVERDEIVKVIKSLMEEMEGEGIRNRIKDLRDAAASALREDGSSTKNLAQLALKWRNLGSTCIGKDH